MRFADLNETSVSFKRCKKGTLFVSGQTNREGGLEKVVGMKTQGMYFPDVWVLSRWL